MTNAQHTPGPWEHHSHCPSSVWRGNKQIAACYSSDPTSNLHANKFGDETQANARLIAAAPDLLETLKYCQAWFERFAPTADLIDGRKAELPMLASVRAAIAKATGNSPKSQAA